tara:strand:+ start:79 stop:339 length:261 start_codon:yes stop_codon:yes gene_type:complete
MNIIVTQDQQIVEIPEGAILIDDVFYVWETRYGLHSTMTKEGRKMLTALKKDDAIMMTRWHLKCEQDGTMEQYTRVIGDSFVSGKL